MGSLPFASPTTSTHFSRRTTLNTASMPLHLPRPTRFHFNSVASRDSPTTLPLQFLPLTRWSSNLRTAASPGDSKHSEIEVERKNDVDLKATEFKEAWKKTVESFTEEALKMQSVSQEAYNLYSKKAMVILKEAAMQFKIQADKAGHDLTVIAKEISEDGKEYISAAAQNSPEPVKDVVETFSSSADNLKEISKVYDFYLGIPYDVE